MSGTGRNTCNPWRTAAAILNQQPTNRLPVPTLISSVNENNSVNYENFLDESATRQEQTNENVELNLLSAGC